MKISFLQNKKIPSFILSLFISTNAFAQSNEVPSSFDKSKKPQQINTAQSNAPRQAFKLSLSGITTTNSKINQSQASLQRNNLLMDFGFKFPISIKRKIFAGVSLGYGQLNYDWNQFSSTPLANTVTLGDWQHINRYSASLSFIFKPEDKWLFILSSKMQKAYAANASASDAISYGSVLTGMYSFPNDNRLGVGVAYLNDLDEVKIMPFVAVKWQINDQWSLTNPFSAGFAGPAGIELRYQYNKNWQFGWGGSRRSQRFLLNDKPQNAEINEWVSFARFGWEITPQLTLNTYTGFIFNGELNISDPDQKYKMDNQGAAAVSVDLRF